MSKEPSLVLNKTKSAIDNFSMLKKNDRVLVGFSGGKDSVALLCALMELSSIYKSEYKFEIFAFHVHHGIRGDEAERDLEFCREFCKEHNVEFGYARVNAPQYSKEKGCGLEEAARTLRYGAFEKYAREKGITKIATAHTASDNLETVLFNLSRGSSSVGLRGIPPVRDNVVRPLIYCTTDEIYGYVNEKRLSYVFDSTNDDTDYTRNHIRHKIVPLLKEINPEAENAVTRMCQTLRRDLEFISDSVGQCCDVEFTDDMLALHDSILSRKLVLMYERATGEKGALDFDHIESMISLLRDKNREGKKYVSLPKKMNFVITKEKVYFEKNDTVLHEVKKPYERVLEYGINNFDEYGFDIFVCEKQDEYEKQIYKNVYKMAIHTAVKKDCITDTITVRCRKEGDFYRYGNMTRKVKKIMNEKGIEPEKRDTIPVFCDDKGIFWIPHFPLRDGMKSEDKDLALHIYYLERQ